MIPSYEFYLYLKLLRNSPKRVVLMSPKENIELLYKKHIEEAKLYLPYIKTSKTVLDLGSGAGFPGIPLAVILRETHFYLLDKKKVHCDFLNNVKHTLNLSNVSIVNMEASLLRRTNLIFDAVVARAVNRIDVILSWIGKNLKENGTVLLGKKKEIKQELNSISKPFYLKELVQTSFGYLVVIKKL